MDQDLERCFLRVSAYIVFQDQIYDLLTSISPKKSMEQRGLRIESYHPDSGLVNKIQGLTEKMLMNPD